MLTLSNRLLSEEIAKEILTAWFATPYDIRGVKGVAALQAIDEQHRREHHDF